jgi:hypothetical protein
MLPLLALSAIRYETMPSASAISDAAAGMHIGDAKVCDVLSLPFRHVAEAALGDELS